MNTIAWVSPAKILGARYGASASLPFSKNDLTSDLQGNLSGGSGFADSYYLPVILGWKWATAAVRAMYGFLAPTGRFSAGANNNVGSGYWTHALSAGQTFYLTGNKLLSLSAFQLYEFHTVQESTGVHPGETFNLDYSLMYSLARTRRFQLQAVLPVMSRSKNNREDRARHQPGGSEKRYAVERPRPEAVPASAEATALDSSISGNSRTGRPFRGTRFRSSRRSASDWEAFVMGKERGSTDARTGCATFKVGCCGRGLLPMPRRTCYFE